MAKKCILVSHEGCELTHIAVLPANATRETINKVIEKSLKSWCCPPDKPYKFLYEKSDGLDHSHMVVRIQYPSGYIDYDGDGAFTVSKVPLHIDC